MTQVQRKKIAKAAPKDCPMKPVRLQLGTVKRLSKILEMVNKKDFGKKVRPDALVDLALSLVGATEIESLRQSSMTNTDRLEAAYRSHAMTEGGISRDKFIGLLLAGRVTASGDSSVTTDAAKMDVHASLM